MDVEVKFSFLKLFNVMKGICRPVKEDECDPDWLENKATQAQREKHQRFNQWAKQNGIEWYNVKYPVMFGKGENQYPGMLATDDIPEGQIFVKVPSKILINTKAAYMCEPLRQIWYDHPDVFGKHVYMGDDNLFNAFILYQYQLKEQSIYWPMMECWPKDADILMNWEEEDLKWLQDETLVQDGMKASDELMESWNTVYKCLSQYPELFKPESISLNRYKWVSILTTNRCFSSTWSGVSQMVPFADNLNHENVDTIYEMLDAEGNAYEDEEETIQKENNDSNKKFFEETQNDLVQIEMELRNKMEAQGYPSATEEKPKIKESLIETNKKEIKKRKINLPDKQLIDDYSSGLESEDDDDLELDQMKEDEQEEERKEKRDKNKQKFNLSKEHAKKIWDDMMINVPETYDFVLKAGKDQFPKGSQVLLCYGRMSNRDMLKRYGFCLTHNKYNNLYIKLKIDTDDPDFAQRSLIIQKFFSVGEVDDQIQIKSSQFKIHFQKLNTKVLKFVKILNYNVKEDNIACITETRSLSLEYIAFQKLKNVYENFLESFGSTLQQDNLLLKEKRQCLTYRQFFAVVYRIEQKKILQNQIKLINIVTHILERIMKGMTLEFAVMRIHELESKKEYTLNRIMIDKYLTQLSKGLKKNQEEYLKNNQVTKEDLKESAKKIRSEMSDVQYRKFEVRGYEKMIDRILEAPLADSMKSNNSELRERLQGIKTNLQEQAKKNQELENKTMREVVANRTEKEKLQAEQVLKSRLDAEEQLREVQKQLASMDISAPLDILDKEYEQRTVKDLNKATQLLKDSSSDEYDSEYESEEEEEEEEQKKDTQEKPQDDKIKSAEIQAKVNIIKKLAEGTIKLTGEENNKSVKIQGAVSKAWFEEPSPERMAELDEKMAKMMLEIQKDTKNFIAAQENRRKEQSALNEQSSPEQK